MSMSNRFIQKGRNLPPELAEAEARIKALAEAQGLDFFETIFVMCTWEEINALAAYGGFPTRYPHWRFGMEYIKQSKSYEYGLSKIYEMVINTAPSYAYLLDNNLQVDQELVMAHVYGHVDFFKNNQWFKHTNRKMLDQMANHASKIKRFMDKYGQETVEKWIDVCLSVDNLIDPYAEHITRHREMTDSDVEKAEEEAEASYRLKNERDYMEDFVNPSEFLADQKEARQKKIEQIKTFPPEPVRDVVQFLIEHSKMSSWQREVLSIIRAEALYFVPQGQTKIMNEGWASYWHTKLMTNHILKDSFHCCGKDPLDVVTYSDHNSGTMAMRPGQFNPYALGVKLYRHIEERWDKGQFGWEWENCEDPEEKKRWDTKAGKGLEKIFQVRKTHNDVSFIDEFMTKEFCEEHGFFTTRQNENGEWVKDSSDFHEVKQTLLDMLSTRGTPTLYVINGNAFNRGELMLKHEHDGRRDIKLEWAQYALENLVKIWGRPVHLRTVVDTTSVVISHDGKEFSMTSHDGTSLGFPFPT